MSNQLPFGDPCPKCGAASSCADERDRICVCCPCWKCGTATLSSCAYCDESLGCKAHALTIEQHVELRCNTTPEQRDRFHAKLTELENDPEMGKLGLAKERREAAKATIREVAP